MSGETGAGLRGTETAWSRERSRETLSAPGRSGARHERAAVDRSATFDALFAAHLRELIQLATLVGADDPEDVVQEAFARLHERWRTLRDPNASVAYLRSSVCNLSRSRLRHLIVARRHQSRLLAVGPPTPEQSAVDGDEKRRLVRELQALPRRQREVLVLRYWTGLSEMAIADTLGISQGAVKSHASRGIAALQQRLGR